MLQIHAGRSGCGHQLLGDQWWSGRPGLAWVLWLWPTAAQQHHSTTAGLDTGACSPALPCSRCGLTGERGTGPWLLETPFTRHWSQASHWSSGICPGLWLAGWCQQLCLLTVVTPFKLGGEMGRAGEHLGRQGGRRNLGNLIRVYLGGTLLWMRMLRWHLCLRGIPRNFVLLWMSCFSEKNELD